MPELDCRHSAHRLDHCCDSGESFELGIVVNPGAGYACPPVRGYCQLFGEHKTEAPSRARAKQHHVIIIHQTIMGAVHRHGRHRDPIAQRHPFERVGTEQIRHSLKSPQKERGRWTRRFRQATNRGRVSFLRTVAIKETGAIQAAIRATLPTRPTQFRNCLPSGSASFKSEMNNVS